MQSTIFNKKNIKDQIHIHELHISKSSLDTHIFACTFLNYSFTQIKPNFTRYSVSPEGHPAPPWFWSVLPKGHPDGLTPLLLICLTCRPPWPPWCWSSWSLPPTHQSSGSWAETGTPSSLAAGSTDQDSVKNCRMYHALLFVKNNCNLIQWTLILFCCWRY